MLPLSHCRPPRAMSTSFLFCYMPLAFPFSQTGSYTIRAVNTIKKAGVLRPYRGSQNRLFFVSKIGRENRDYRLYGKRLIMDDLTFLWSGFFKLLKFSMQHFSLLLIRSFPVGLGLFDNELSCFVFDLAAYIEELFCEFSRLSETHPVFLGD